MTAKAHLRRPPLWQWGLGIALWSATAPALAQPTVTPESSPILTDPTSPTQDSPPTLPQILTAPANPIPGLPRATIACPTDLETLLPLLLRDLPSYANRKIQNARRFGGSLRTTSYVIIAGRPETAPLTLGPGVYAPAAPNASDQNGFQQVFLTTLERSYSTRFLQEVQHYHWLFLTPVSDGWRLGMMYSRIGEGPDAGKAVTGDDYTVTTPPQESSTGAIGQAVQDWLRDCRAGKISP